MALKTHRLTNQRIAAALKLGKKTWLCDDIALRGWGRLLARISNRATALFYFRYCVDGRYRSIGLGPHSEQERAGFLTLEQARDEAARLSALYRNPTTRDLHAALTSDHATAPSSLAPRMPLPSNEGPKSALGSASAAAVSLLALVELYQAQLKEDGKVSWREVAGMIKRGLAPAELARKSAAEITPKDLVEILRDVVKRGPRSAAKLQCTIHAAYEAAMKSCLDAQRLPGWQLFELASNPVRGMGKITYKKTKKERALNGRDLGLLWNHLNDSPDRESIGYRCLRINILLCGQRCKQLLRATLVNIDEYDRTLTLHDGKGRRAEPRQHILPLSDLVWQEVSELASIAKAQNSEFLFAGRRGSGACDPQTISHLTTKISNELAAKEFGGRNVERFTYADLRRTTESRLGELEVTKEMKAQLLSHGLNGVQETHYDRYRYIKQKRDVLAVWERYLLKMAEEQRSAYLQGTGRSGC